MLLTNAPAPVAAPVAEADDAAEPPAVEPVAEPLVAADPQRGSRLSPREIQALLRAGKTPAVVAKAADVDQARVLRWLPPIEAERERIISRARAARVVKSRLGASAEPLGRAVDANLAARRAGDDVTWSAVRRDGDPLWVVSVRYRSRGKQRRAQWRYDPETGDVQPQDQAAAELSWMRTAPRAAAHGADAPPPRPATRAKTTKKAAPAKKAAKTTTVAAAKAAGARGAAAKKASAPAARTGSRARPPS